MARLSVFFLTLSLLALAPVATAESLESPFTGFVQSLWETLESLVAWFAFPAENTKFNGYIIPSGATEPPPENDEGNFGGYVVPNG